MAPYVLPLLTAMLWTVHVGLAVTGSGTTRARRTVRWGCLAGAPVAWLGTYLWWAVLVPDALSNHIYDMRPLAVAVLVNLFVGIVAWSLFLLVEPLVVWRGRRATDQRRPRGAAGGAL